MSANDPQLKKWIGEWERASITCPLLPRLPRYEGSHLNVISTLNSTFHALLYPLKLGTKVNHSPSAPKTSLKQPRV